MLALRSAAPTVTNERPHVLVLNASREMATHISLELHRGIVGCAILYAPSIELARLVLRRTKVDLIVASTVLPDGGVSRLQAALQEHAERTYGQSLPTLILVGEAPTEPIESLTRRGYTLSDLHRFESSAPSKEPSVVSLSGRELRVRPHGYRRISPVAQSRALQSDHYSKSQGLSARRLTPTPASTAAQKGAPAPVTSPKTPQETESPATRVESVSADLRNDLNNPLQEIVTMVFIARSASPQSDATTTQALDAIDRAAKNMANIVRSIETKIQGVLDPRMA